MLVGSLLCVLSAVAAVSQDDVASFAQWRAEHGKVYATEAEASHRLGIFANELQIIRAHNAKHAAGRSGYKCGLNQFSDLTDAEFRAAVAMPAAGSIVRSERGPSDAKWTAFENRNVGVGAAIDWRDKGMVGPVQSQGNCGSCWAFAGVGAAASTFAIRNKQKAPYVVGAVQEIMDCCQSSQPNMSGFDCNACQGGEPKDMMGFIAKVGGLAAQSDWPYVSGRDDKPRACNSTKEFAPASNVIKIDGGARPPTNNETALLQALASRAVAVDIDVAGSFRRYASGVFDDPACGYSICHATLLVGFNHSGKGSIPGSNATGYTIMQNSWSTGWGDKGYIKIGTSIEAAGPRGLCSVNSYPAVALLNEDE